MKLFTKIIISLFFILILIFEIITIAPIIVILIEHMIYKDDVTLLKYQIDRIFLK